MLRCGREVAVECAVGGRTIRGKSWRGVENDPRLRNLPPRHFTPFQSQNLSPLPSSITRSSSERGIPYVGPGDLNEQAY